MSRLFQYSEASGRGVGVVDLEGKGDARRLDGIQSVLELAQRAIDKDMPIAVLAGELAGDEIDYGGLLDKGFVLPPIDHPDPTRLLVSGTGLTHTGSVKTRDEMHAKDKQGSEAKTDSQRMFDSGMEGGKPADGEFFGSEPEWFYKGDGSWIVPPGGELQQPAYALDGGEEPEIAGVYLVDNECVPRRIGFVLANEFSDHVTEKQNYLLLAHSKLRQCSLGPEILLGDLPREVEGTSLIRRGGETVWERPFLSGEANMCHSLANLERHMFKYSLFRRPRSVHVHFFGTATLSFADGFKTQDGDEFSIECPAFGRPLANTLRVEPQPGRRVDVKPL